MAEQRAFVAIPASQVDPELRRSARLAGEIGTDRLGISNVLLVWVLPESGTPDRPGTARHVQPGTWSGWVYDDDPGSRVYVRADMPRHVMPTVLHELRHLAQLRDHGTFDEDDAEQWAQRVMQTPLQGVTPCP